MLHSTLVDPRSGDEWDRCVEQHAHANIFHTSAWAKVLCDTYGHIPFYLRFHAAEQTAALLPMMEVASAITGRRGVTLPFSDFCGPLNSSSSLDETALLDRASALARERGWKYLELRATPASTAAITPSKSYYSHRLDLSASEDELSAACDSAFRRSLRKAERAEMRLEISTSDSAVRDFYRLQSRTRRRHGIPPQPFRFFANIAKHILKRELGFIVLAYLGSRPVAAAMFFHFKRQAVFKYGASDERHQEHRASNLVMWEGVKRCRSLGLETLHLGRTDLDHAGLRRFKLSLGAREEILRYFRFDPAHARWIPESKRSLPISPGIVFRRLPLTLNQLAGTMLYRHLH